MKKIVALVITAVYLISSVSVFAEYVNPDTTNWFAYSSPNLSSLKGTALDASSVLDAPAGKHGFVIADGDSLKFEDGTKAKFWGTNVSAGALFLSKENTDALVDTIASRGYNMVRFSNIDANWAGTNIFGAKPSDGSRRNTSELDEENLDKIEYFWAKLKENGIYLYMDLRYLREVSYDQIPDEHKDKFSDSGNNIAGGVNNGLKGLSFFDDDEIFVDIMLDYARKFLWHKNPYTGTCLAEDPTLAVLSIANEDTLWVDSWYEWTIWTNTYSANNMNNGFRNWLISKYGSLSGISSAWKDGYYYSLDKVTITSDFYKKSFSDTHFRDIYEYFAYRESAYYKRMKELLKKSYDEGGGGVKALINASNLSAPVAELSAWAEAEMDVIDQHMYYNHPIADSNEFWIDPGDKLNEQTFLPMIKNKEKNLITSIGNKDVYNKPYFVSEWCLVAPGDYNAEGNYMMAAYSSLNSWNPLQYEMTSQWPGIAEGSFSGNTIWSICHPGYVVTAPASAYMMLKNHISEEKSTYGVNPNSSDYYQKNTYENPVPDSAPFVAKAGLTFDSVHSAVEIESSQQNNAVIESRMNQENIVSLTDELSINMTDGIFSVNTDKTKLASGFIKNREFSLDGVEIKSDNEYASVAVTSLTNEKITNSDNILITTLARYRNKGTELNGETLTADKTGGGSIYYEPVECEVTIDTDIVYEVWALNVSGKRVKKVSSQRTEDGKLLLNLSGSEYKTCHYELVKSGIEATYNVDERLCTVTGETETSNEKFSVTVTNPMGKKIDGGISETKDGRINYSFMLETVTTGTYELELVYEKTGYTVKTEFIVAMSSEKPKIVFNGVTGVFTVSGDVEEADELSFMVYSPENELMYIDQIYSKDGKYRFDFKCDSVSDGNYVFLLQTQSNGYSMQVKADVDSLLRISEAVFTLENNVLKAKINASRGFSAILAEYEDGTLTKAEPYVSETDKLAEHKITIDYTEGKSYRLYVMEDLKNLVPVMSVQEFIR